VPCHFDDGVLIKKHIGKNSMQTMVMQIFHTYSMRGGSYSWITDHRYVLLLLLLPPIYSLPQDPASDGDHTSPAEPAAYAVGSHMNRVRADTARTWDPKLQPSG
jgi:hypothetical protein